MTPEADELSRQAEQFRASGLLGKPGALSRLFDFLLERSRRGESPKELEIAVHVFGKNPAFDVSQDAVVRVYVHKLRRRLESFHAQDPSAAGVGRLAIPKGEYRLILEPVDAPAVVETPAVAPRPATATRSRTRWLPIAAAVAALVIGVLLGGALFGSRDPVLSEVRHSAVWAPLLEDDLPITIVVGDYYLLGESDTPGGGVHRLVREFFINSREDFADHLRLNPQLMQRYHNLDLTYLPVASAWALQDIVPVLATKKRVRVMLMSQLDANVLKTSHIVYLGYISGLGMLGDRVFAASRVSPGGSFDELIDARTHITYVSTAQGNAADDGGSSSDDFIDYGYFSTFVGPDGNRIVVIAGTRDNGVIQMAEALSRPASVRRICEQAGAATSFESLYEVSGMAKTGLNARLLFVSAMNAEHVWEARE